MRQETWILAADERAARIFSRQGDSLKPITDLVAGEPGVETEISNSTVGRTTAPRAARHKLEPTMEQSRQIQTAFAGKIASVINDAARRDAFEQLVVVAAPKMLGYLRDRLDDNARRHITAEIDKEFAHLAEHKLEKKLLEILKDPDELGRGRPTLH
jgi:protein required for attachment to host cells